MSDSASSEESDGSVSQWQAANGKTIAEYSVLWEYRRGLSRDDILGNQGNRFTFKLDSENASSTGDNYTLFFRYGHGNASYSCRKLADKNIFSDFHLLTTDKEMREAGYTGLKIEFVNNPGDEESPLLAWFMNLRDHHGNQCYLDG
jgi:hypothetical protein